MKTFELFQKRKDGSISSVTFIQAFTLKEAKEIAGVCFCVGEKVLTENKP